MKQILNFVNLFIIKVEINLSQFFFKFNEFSNIHLHKIKQTYE